MSEDKKNALKLFSNYNVAKQKTREYLGDDVKLLISPRKDKKYRVYDPNGKAVDFGQMGFQDHTLTGSENKRRLFRARNHKWKNAPKYSPAWLSYWILW